MTLENIFKWFVEKIEDKHIPYRCEKKLGNQKVMYIYSLFYEPIVKLTFTAEHEGKIAYTVIGSQATMVFEKEECVKKVKKVYDASCIK